MSYITRIFGYALFFEKQVLLSQATLKSFSFLVAFAKRYFIHPAIFHDWCQAIFQVLVSRYFFALQIFALSLKNYKGTCLSLIRNNFFRSEDVSSARNYFQNEVSGNFLSRFTNCLFQALPLNRNF